MDVYDSSENLMLPDIICTCGRRNLNRLTPLYYDRAVKAGEEVRETQINNYLQIKKSNLKGLKKQNALDKLQEDGKDILQRKLRQVFTELGIDRDCCRMHISNSLRGRYETTRYNGNNKPYLVELIFDDTEYYDLNKIYDYLNRGGS